MNAALPDPSTSTIAASVYSKYSKKCRKQPEPSTASSFSGVSPPAGCDRIGMHAAIAASPEPSPATIASGMSPPAGYEGESKELYHIIDQVLVQAIATTGWPIWITTGEGGDVPKRLDCDFAQYKLQWCARVDFRRGEAADDWMNRKWAELFENLPS